MARYTILSLLFTAIKIVLLFYCPKLMTSNRTLLVQAIASAVFIFCIITIFLDFFYIQRITDNGKTKRRIRFRPVYFIKGFICDIIEIEFFKKNFRIKTPAFLLIFGIGDKTAYSKITDWAIRAANAQVFAINRYEKKYADYRDYVDLWQHFSLCGELSEIINSGRAVNIQGALDVVDVRRHRQRLENIRRQEMEAVRSAMTRMSDAVSDAAAQVSNAAMQTEKAEKAREDFYRQTDY